MALMLAVLLLLSQSAVAIHGVLDIHPDASHSGMHDNSDARPCQLCLSLHGATPAPILMSVRLAAPHRIAPAIFDPAQITPIYVFPLSIRPPPPLV